MVLNMKHENYTREELSEQVQELQYSNEIYSCIFGIVRAFIIGGIIGVILAFII